MGSSGRFLGEIQITPTSRKDQSAIIRRLDNGGDARPSARIPSLSYCTRFVIFGLNQSCHVQVKASSIRPCVIINTFLEQRKVIESPTWKGVLRSQFGFLGYMNTPATFKKEIEQIKENTKCFHSKVPYTSDILGIPVDVKVKQFV